jgi:hypothetical protein
MSKLLILCSSLLLAASTAFAQQPQTDSAGNVISNGQTSSVNQAADAAQQGLNSANQAAASAAKTAETSSRVNRENPNTQKASDISQDLFTDHN